MSSTHTLVREQLIPRPLDEVFPFFADAGDLQMITPPWLHFRILTPLPLELQTGAILEYRLRLYGIPLYWRTRIEDFDAPRRFIDQQLQGPYRRWHPTIRNSIPSSRSARSIHGSIHSIRPSTL